MISMSNRLLPTALKAHCIAMPVLAEEDQIVLGWTVHIARR